MSHSHHGGDGSSASGIPSNFDLQRVYWTAVGAVIGAAALGNILNKVVLAQRVTDATLTPSKPKSFIFKAYASSTAVIREFSHASIPPLVVGNLTLRMPPVGQLSLMLANLTLSMILCFYKLNTLDQWSWENVGHRTGMIAVAQLPFIFLLAGKNNIIGFLTGTSYERLNWLHRWISRTLWVITTIHMGFFFRSWGRYDYIIVKLSRDPLTQRGFAAWCILTFLVMVSLGPVRRLSYEVFVLIHIVLFSAFIAVVWFHTPAQVKAYVWIPIGLFIFDRVVRYAFMAFTNIPILSFRRNTSSTGQSSLWMNKATFEPLPGNVTRITISNPRISWAPGQHALLSCHSIIPFQSHPFTISSLPSDNKLEFLVRAENGGTKRIFNFASKPDRLLGSTSASENTKCVTIDGPYGRIRPLRQFDSVVLFAGSMGATFTMPLLRDIIEGWKNEYLDPTMARSTALFHPNFALTQRVRYVWVVRAQTYLRWFSEQLNGVMRDIDRCGDGSGSNSFHDSSKTLEITIYVTCDTQCCSDPNSFTTHPDSRSSSFSQESTALCDHEQISALQTPLSPKTDVNAAGAKNCHRQDDCCFTKEIADETTPFSPCVFSGPVSILPDQSADTVPEKAPASAAGSRFVLDPRIKVRFGRPDTRTIIRSVLEKAEGESAVVVCGPGSLNDSVRQNVVSLSDERAVHKGTGAQGIYLHVEEFGF